MGKVFRGRYWDGVVSVTVNGQPLTLPSDVIAIGDHEFSWGRLGPGVRKLALAILLQCVDRDLAALWHDRFAQKVLLSLAGNVWTITEEQIAQWITDEVIHELWPDHEWRDRSGCSE